MHRHRFQMAMTIGIPQYSWTFFHMFVDAESLRVTEEIGSYVAHALRGTTGELPIMREFYVEDQDDFASVQTALAPFIASRRRSYCIISVHPWEPSDSSASQCHTGLDRLPESLIHRNDPTSALEEDIRQTCESLSPRSFTIHSLHQRAQFLLLSLMQNRRAKELDNLIEIARDVFEMRFKQMRRVELLRMLAFCHALGTHDPEHGNKSVSMFQDASQDESATTSERLSIAWWWATFARAWDHPTATLAYQNTQSALRLAFTEVLTIQRQSSTTGRLDSKIHMPLEFASYPIEKGQLELAVETIEQGKTLIWSEIYGLRTSARRLRTVNPNLVDRLATVNQKPLTVNASIWDRLAIGSRLSEEEDYEHIHLQSYVQGAATTLAQTSGNRRRNKGLTRLRESHTGCTIVPSRMLLLVGRSLSSLRQSLSLALRYSHRSSRLTAVPHSQDRRILGTRNKLTGILLAARKKYAVELELYQ